MDSMQQRGHHRHLPSTHPLDPLYFLTFELYQRIIQPKIKFQTKKINSKNKSEKVPLDISLTFIIQVLPTDSANPCATLFSIFLKIYLHFFTQNLLQNFI